MPVHDDPTHEVTDLVASLIRNACVNDGTPTSGQEHRSADLLEAVLAGPGLDVQRFEPTPGRTSLVARIEGHDPKAPTLVLLGHTDVVPVNPDRWHEDPFAADVIDGVLWGRGAIDMLNLTGSMALATRRLADRGFRPRGTLVYVAVADEEALGEHGAAWLTAHEWDAVGGQYVITESGGVPTPTPAGTRLGVTVGEKGAMWCKLVVRGTSGHASRPLRTDNALVKAAEVVRRISGFRAPVEIGEEWRRYVEEMGFSRDLASALVDPERLDATVAELPQLGLARQAHACTRTTMSPTVIRGGTKTNVIPDRVDVEIDIRSLPGQTAADVRAIVESAVGDLAPDVHIDWLIDDPASASPMRTPLWVALEQITARLAPQTRCVPTLTPGATDARFYRRRGSVAYGFGLFSGRLSLEDMASMFHGDDERIDLESLRLSTELWESLAAEFLA